MEYKYEDLYFENSIDKKISIKSDELEITNRDIFGEEFSIEEGICWGDNLEFGRCEAGMLKVRIANVFPMLEGKELIVSETLAGHMDAPFILGKYRVLSDKLTADRSKRDIIAYDAMYDILVAEVSGWYNTLLPDKDSTVTLKQFRDNFFEYLGIEQEEISLINDAMPVKKTIEPSQLTGKTVIMAICEINGCFGHITREGKIRYVHLKEMIPGVYPSDTLYPRDDLYPADVENAEEISKSSYISCQYESFETQRIDKLVIRKEENDIGGSAGDGENCYVIQDNFLVYGKSGAELDSIAENILEVIGNIWYRPAKVEAVGNPCLEVGDGICIETKKDIVYTYILQRKLKGIQALKDTYEAAGEKNYQNKRQGIREQIIELRGKTNTLFRSVEETRLEIKDIEQGLSSRITQTAREIEAEVKRAQGTEVELAAAIRITEESITQEVRRSTEAEGNLAAQIGVNAQQILLKVSKNNIISEINQTAEQITIKANKIDLQGLVTATEFVTKFATIDSLNAVSVNIKGELNAVNANIHGELNAMNATISGKLNVNEFNAQNISAMGITVQSANVVGGFSAGKITSGQLSASRIDVSSLIADDRIKSATLYTGGLYTSGTLNVRGTVAVWKTISIGGTYYRILAADD